MLRQLTELIGRKSTAKISFSLGSRISSVLSEWLRPTSISSSVVPPSSMLRCLSTASSTGVMSAKFSSARRSLARLCATKVAPASLNGLPPAM